jgi:hypothetical protein
MSNLADDASRFAGDAVCLEQTYTDRRLIMHPDGRWQPRREPGRARRAPGVSQGASDVENAPDNAAKDVGDAVSVACVITSIAPIRLIATYRSETPRALARVSRTTVRPPLGGSHQWATW